VVNDDERELIWALVTIPAGPEPLERDGFLTAFGATDGVVLGLDLLRDAIARQDGVDAEYALIVTFKFGLTPEHVSLFLTLASADWHHCHEDVASALQQLRPLNAVPVLEKLTMKEFDYLAYDEGRALARKCTWALADIGTTAAREALGRLTQFSDPQIASYAARRLSEWSSELDRKR
jgi:hypothetical protein